MCPAIVNTVAMNRNAQISLQVPTFNSSVYTSRSGVAGSHGNFVLRNHHTIFHGSCTILQQYVRVPLLHILSTCLFCCCCCFTAAILIGVKGYHIVVLIYISFMINEAEDLVSLPYFKRSYFSLLLRALQPFLIT